jgi:prepilin peptidase CpaA
MNPSIDTFLIVVLSCTLIAGAVIDFRCRKIPNRLTYPAMTIALAYHGLTRGLDGLAFGAGGMALGMGIFFLPWLMGAMGAGDAKLMGAVGAALGPRGVFLACLSTALAGGILSLFVLWIQRRGGKNFIIRCAEGFMTFPGAKRLLSINPGKNGQKTTTCYGVAIASGTLFYVVTESYWHGFVF